MSVPTIKAVLLPHHVKADGSCLVKIRVTHNRKSRYINTTEVAHKGDYTKDLVIKNNSMIRRLSTLIEEIQGHVNEIGTFKVRTMDVDHLVEIITIKMSKEEFSLDFFEWMETYVADKPKYSATNYRTACNSFKRFLGKDRMDIREITSSMMRQYESHLRKKHGNDARAVSLYTSAIASIHKAAQRRYNDNEIGEPLIKDPFAYYTPPKQKPARKRTIDAETIQKLIDMRGCLGEYHKIAVDTFLLSFVLMGTNVPDLHCATREGDVVCYNRTKTKDRRHDKAEMRIRLEPVCSALIKDMEDPTGERAFNLHLRYSHYKSIADKGNGRLKEVADLLGVPQFTMYSARHTWASLAFSIGIPKSLINDCLCHVDPAMSVTDIYIKKDWSVLWEANRKVLEQFVWK